MQTKKTKRARISINNRATNSQQSPFSPPPSLVAQSNESLCRAKSQRTGSLAAASIRALCAKTDLRR